jgi:gliding motility-associated-like protein
MKKYLGTIIFFLCLFAFFQGKSAHQVGGYIEYRCLPNASLLENTFEVTFRFYVDSASLSTGNTPTDSIPITVFNSNNTQTDYFYLSNLIRITTIPDDVNNPCVVSSPPVSVAEYLYRDTVNFPKIGTYKLVYQRCCKNNILNNLVGSSNFYGNTFSVDIPDLVNCNSTPIFNSQPPIVVCAGFDINLDMSAIDADGDSLVYSLCAPFDFNQSQLANNNPAPDTSNRPPYIEIAFQLPQSGSNPIPSNPQIAIDRNTGILSGVPSNSGGYLLGFCVEEYRNGALINTFRRDIQISTANCSPLIVSAIQNQTQFCDGLSVQFDNTSTSNGNAPNFFWDFGLNGVLNDTSRATNPSFTYPDTGLYAITLIVNPDFPRCSDTTVEFFQVNDTLAPILTLVGDKCFNNNSFNFTVDGTFESYATFEWDFGTQASVQNSANQTVNNVTLSSSGSFPIKLTVSQDKCTEVLNQSINLFENPVGDFFTADTTGCSPHNVQFTSNISDPGAAGNLGTYKWNFGDGSPISNLVNPTHRFNQDGSYQVILTYESTGNCIDILEISKPNLVRVGRQFSNNNTNFTTTPSSGCFPLPVQFTNLSTFDGTATYIWDFGDGSPTSSAENPMHTYDADGFYDVTLTMTTAGGCAETITKQTDSAIHVSVEFSKNNVDFTVQQDTGCAPVEIQFTNTSFTEGAANFTWSFGDGSPISRDPNPLHTYETNGIFDVQLILESTVKCIETIDTIKPAFITTDRSYSTNEVDFDFFPKEGCPPLTVQFFDSSKFLGTPLYFWDFGDGSDFSSETNPTYTFQDTGSYSIGLLLITSDKCVDTISTLVNSAVKVFPQPIAQINFLDTAKSLKEALFQFNNIGSQFVASSRYLINGIEVGQSDILNYQFTDTGHFKVSYIATNTFNCEDTSTAEVFVFDEFQFVIPNIFTPNGDFINDEFKMQACGVYDYNIKVFTRFGEKIFESNSLHLNWDGTRKGKAVNSGTYFYTIKILQFQNKILDYQGSITLLKD